MSLLITPTLLNSYAWLKKCPSSWKERAMQGLSDTLNRVWVEQPPDSPMMKGIEFEDTVYKMVNAKVFNKGSKLFQETCEAVRGGKFQKKSKKIIHVGEKEFCIYGKLDVWFPNKIIDIKTTGNWKGDRNYLDTWQHIFYTYTEKIKHFQYFVIEWTKDGKFKLQAIHKVDYVAEDLNHNFVMITKGIADFMGFLNQNKDLEDAYLNKFNLYN